MAVPESHMSAEESLYEASHRLGTDVGVGLVVGLDRDIAQPQGIYQ